MQRHDPAHKHTKPHARARAQDTRTHTEHTLTHTDACVPVPAQVRQPRTAQTQRAHFPGGTHRTRRAPLSPAHAVSTHAHTAHQQPHAGATRASAQHPACTLTHTHARFRHKPACQERFILQLGGRRQWAPSRTLQADLAAGTDTLPIPPKSPSLPPAPLHLTP